MEDESPVVEPRQEAVAEPPSPKAVVESPKAARGKSPMAPRHRPRKEPKEPRKAPCKVRTAPLATPLEPPPPLDVTFFGDLFRTQRKLERERQVDRLSNFRIA